MSEPRRPEDGSTQSSTPAWDQPASTGADASADSRPATPAREDPLVGTPASEPTVVTSNEPAWATQAAQSGGSEASQEQTYEPVSTETTYQPAYTPPAAAQSAYPPAYQQPPATSYQQQDQQSAYPPAYQQPPATGYQQQQQPPYPPQYQQPAAAWGQPQSGWAQQPIYEYGSSVLVILGGIVLVLFGLLVTLFGVVVIIAGQATSALPFEQVGLDPEAVAGLISIVGIVFLVIGVLHLLAGVFAFAHRSWARFVAIILGMLGVLLGVLVLFGGLQPATTTVIEGTQITTDPQSALISGIVLTLAYGLVVVGMIVGGDHFRKRPVQ